MKFLEAKKRRLLWGQSQHRKQPRKKGKENDQTDSRQAARKSQRRDCNQTRNFSDPSTDGTLGFANNGTSPNSGQGKTARRERPDEQKMDKLT